MLAVPPALLELLNLRAGAQVGVGVDNGRLIVEPNQRPRYSLDELLAQCDPSAAQSTEESDWLKGNPVGRELL